MGKFNRAAITFDLDFLKKLSEDEKNSVIVKKLTQHLALHPFHLNDVSASIKEILKVGVAKYSKGLGGILLGFQNIQLVSDLGSTNFDTCLIHLDIIADFYLFIPEVGKQLKAIVTKVTKDHVSCLLYNAFNISLPRPEHEKHWLGTKALPGQEVVFEITTVNVSFRFPYIRGKIISLDSSNIIGNKINLQCFDEEDEEQYEEISTSEKFDEAETLFEYELPRKKSKKHKVCFEDEIETENESYSKKSLKKRKRDLEIEFTGDETKELKKLKRKLEEDSLEIEETPKKRRLSGSISEERSFENSYHLQQKKKKKRTSSMMDEEEEDLSYLKKKSKKRKESN